MSKKKVICVVELQRWLLKACGRIITLKHAHQSHENRWVPQEVPSNLPLWTSRRNIWIPRGPWWPFGENGGELCVLRVYDVLSCVIRIWHFIWKRFVENVIWFSFVGAYLKMGGWTRWPPGFRPNSEVFVVVWVYDKCKICFPAQQPIFVYGFRVYKTFSTNSILSLRRLKGWGEKVPVNSRLEYIIYNMFGIFLCVVCFQDGR